MAWRLIIPTIVNCINSCKYTSGRSINLFQFQLNQALEYPAFSYSKGYCFYILFTYVACWYGFMLPLGTPIIIIVFIGQYWVNKFNLFRRSSKPAPFSQEIVQLVNKFFGLSLFVFALGFYLWQSSVHFDTPNGTRFINIVTLVLASLWSLWMIFAPANFRNKILGEEISFQQYNYSHYKRQGYFVKTYLR